MQLNGSKIVLTGASAGIGKALCLALLDEGARILAVARRVNVLDYEHPNLIYRECDISTQDGVDRLFQMAEQELGGIDIFINNAGFSYYEMIGEPDWQRIDKIFRTNVYAPIYALQKLKQLKGSAPFNFMITASAMSWMALPGYTLYSSTKAALKGFADGLRFELGRDQHIQMVCPIATRTEFFSATGSENVKVPFPSQSAEHVAARMVQGLRENKPYIFPSKIFVITNKLNQLFAAGIPYQWWEARKLKRWARENA